MQGLLTALRRGFNKWIGWKRLGIAASLLIIGFAIATLVRTLKGVDKGAILTALTDIPPGNIALAALALSTFAAPGLGWLALTGAAGIVAWLLAGFARCKP